MMYYSYIKEGLFNYLILFIFLVGIEFLISKIYKRSKIEVSRGFWIGWQIFACFIIGILSITGAAGIQEIVRHKTSLIGWNEISLIPFQWSIGIAFGLIMNIILFIPIGIGIPLLWKQGKKFRHTLLLGIMFSVFIEVSQLFNFRATDIDDLLMNTLGTIIGYGIFRMLFSKCTLFHANNDKGTWKVKNSAFITIASILFFYFFIGSPILYWVKGMI